MSDTPETATEPFIHEKRYDERCKICTFPQRAFFEKCYIQRDTVELLTKTFGFTTEEMHKHGRAVKIYGKRMDNTNAIRRGVLEKGIEGIENGTIEITLKDVLRSAFDLDKVKGRIVDKVQVNAPKVILLAGIPLPGGQRSAKPPELTKPERKSPLLIPSKVEIVSETTVESEPENK